MNTEKIIQENLNEGSLIKTFNESSLNRARRTAMILGGVLIVSLLAVVFAFVQVTLFEEMTRRKTEMENTLRVCVQEAQKQQALEVENRLIMEEANKMAEEQLRACQARK